LLHEVSVPPLTGLATLRDRFASVFPGAAAFVAVVSVSASQGGYFPTAWGWIALGLCWLAVMGLVLGATLELSTLERATAGFFALFTGWVALSALWSTSLPQTMQELERDLIYPVALVAFIAITRSGRFASVFVGVLAGVTGVAAYALGTRLLQGVVSESQIAGLRLSTPIGYWNGLGIVCVVGVLLAVAFVADARSVLGRALAAACVPALVLTVYFTFSRGSWAALVAGLVVIALVSPTRLRLATTVAVLAPWAGAAVLLASRQGALITTGATLGAARHDGHRVALALLALTLGAAASGGVFGLVDRRWRPDQIVRRMSAVSLSVAGLVALVVAFAVYGTPWSLAQRGYRSFTRSTVVPPTPNYNLNKRLFSLSSNGRTSLWRLAWRQTKLHPLRGSGAGTYGAYYLEHRTSRGVVRDAHSLYIEQLAEVGGIGLVLLVGALLGPVAGALRARGAPYVVPGLGAYAAFLVHQGYDWDWEIPAVTLVGLLIGAALVGAARQADTRRFGSATRWTTVGVVAAVAVFSFVGLVGNRDLAQAGSALSYGKYGAAAAKSRAAADWAPWAAEPWRVLALAQVGSNRRQEALHSLRAAIAKDPTDAASWAALKTYSTGAESRHAQRVLVRLDPLTFRRRSR
jgi:hypothetical protein